MFTSPEIEINLPVYIKGKHRWNIMFSLSTNQLNILFTDLETRLNLSFNSMESAVNMVMKYYKQRLTGFEPDTSS